MFGFDDGQCECEQKTWLDRESSVQTWLVFLSWGEGTFYQAALCLSMPPLNLFAIDPRPSQALINEPSQSSVHARSTMCDVLVPDVSYPDASISSPGASRETHSDRNGQRMFCEKHPTTHTRKDRGHSPFG